jgi:hypothetical protein
MPVLIAPVPGIRKGGRRRESSRRLALLPDLRSESGGASISSRSAFLFVMSTQNAKPFYCPSASARGCGRLLVPRVWCIGARPEERGDRIRGRAALDANLAVGSVRPFEEIVDLAFVPSQQPPNLVEERCSLVVLNKEKFVHYNLYF